MADNTQITGTISATPQNPYLAPLARGARSLQELASQYKIPQAVPLLGGTGVDELLGLPGAARELENWSYGNYPLQINPYAGRTASYMPEMKRGRASDLADTVFLGLDSAGLGKLAARGAQSGVRLAGQEINRAMLDNSGALARFVPEAVKPLNVVKPKGGGGWLTGDVDNALGKLKRDNQPILSGEIVNAAAGRDLFSEYRKVYDQNPEIGLHDWMRANYPDIYAEIQGPEAKAADRWIKKKLIPYVQNDMATPEDPIRGLAERGILHISPNDLNYRLEAYGKYPLPDQQFLATSDAAKMWEGASDNAFNVWRASDYTKFMNDSEYAKKIEKNPWLLKVPPETKVYSVYDEDFQHFADDLGFTHLIDELKNAMDPATDLPRNLRIDPKSIDQITMPQAVERVAQINAWRAEEAAKAERAGMMANLQATPRLADNELQLSFVDKPGGAWVDIPETVNDEGMKLCTSIGKAGGWCTRGEGLAERYGSGDNRLATLLDTDGRPHAQATITKSRKTPYDTWYQSQSLGSVELQAFERYLLENRQRLRETGPGGLENWYLRWAEETGRPIAQPSQDITELKPVGNSFDSDRAREYARRDPQYEAKVTDSVLKFLNSGEWGKVKDLRYYDIVDLKDPGRVMGELNKFASDRRQFVSLVDAFNHAVQVEPNANRFMTSRQLRDFVGPVEPLEGYAGGGLVKGAVKSIGELVQKYLAKEGVEAVVEAAPKEQKMLQGFYRGYAGENKPAQTAFGTETYFVSPQRKVADYYAKRRAAEIGEDPHAEMILVDPFLLRNDPYGLSIPIDKYNRDFLTTRARRVDPDEVQSRTPLYAAGGAVRTYDPTEIDAIVANISKGYAKGGLKTHDGFDAVENPDGSVSTEISITVQDPRLNEGRPTNIPSLWERKVVDDDTAVERALKSGKHYTSYDTIEQAVRAARQRSSDLGAVLHKASGGLITKGLTKAVKGILPQAEREANLAKLLEPSAVKSRLYHGTKAHDDYADRPGQAFEQFTGRPTWLAQEPYIASGYSGSTGSTYPVFAQIKKPLILTFDANDDANKAFKTAELLGVDVEHIKRMSKPEKAWEVINHPAFIDAVEKAGYDGLAINEGGYKTFGLLDPRKIKSAIGNRGTYDTTEPDITKAEGGKVSADDVFETTDELNLELPKKQRRAEKSSIEELLSKYKSNSSAPNFSPREPELFGMNANKNSINGRDIQTLAIRAGVDPVMIAASLSQMTDLEKRELMYMLSARAQASLGNASLGAQYTRPLDAPAGVYSVGADVSYPIGKGRIQGGFMQSHWPQGSQDTYNIGYNGKVGPGYLSIGAALPKGQRPMGQASYTIPFAEGGYVKYDPVAVDQIVNQVREGSYA